MKKILFSFFMIIATSLLLSCNNQPQVTSRELVVEEEPQYGYDYYGNISFKGTKKVSKGWLHWDDNKECPFQNGYTFRVLKPTSTGILKSDRCDHCGYTWSLHD